MSELNKYRYSRLYETLLNWYKCDSEKIDETTGEMEARRLLNRFLDDIGKYDMIRPLIDKKFLTELDKRRDEGQSILKELVTVEKSDGTHSENFSNIKGSYFENSIEFSRLLKNSINGQLEIRLNNK